MKGIITFYINVETAEEGKKLEFLSLMKQANTELIQKLEQHGYWVMVVPVEKESSRIEKVDFDLPFPRYVLPHIDLAEQEKIMDEIKTKALKDVENE